MQYIKIWIFWSIITKLYLKNEINVEDKWSRDWYYVMQNNINIDKEITSYIRHYDQYIRDNVSSKTLLILIISLIEFT